MASDRNALTIPQGAALLEKIVITGDLKELTPAERVGYYRQVCESLGLNPLSKAFDYITLNGKLTLYARKDATDQLRRRDGVSVTGLETQVIQDVYIVKAVARIGDRTDMATGAVSIAGLKGETLANAMLKAETKAKRRVTLSICGLGMLDETEVQDVAEAKPVQVDATTGEIKPTPPASNGVGAMPFTQYIEDRTTLGRFWAWVKSKGLTEDDVHAALNVQHLANVEGTVAGVKAAIESYAASLKATAPGLFDTAPEQAVQP